MNFKSYYRKKQLYVERKLAAVFKGVPAPGGLKEAMSYSLLAGGKRLRPVILLMTDDLLKGPAGPKPAPAVTAMALSLELIHTYSLIHDDLPAMDNDDLRRGKPTCHKKFGEAAAILAGDGLLTFAFELMSRESGPGRAKAILKCQNLLARCAGPAGMVGGQVLDMAAEDSAVDLAGLKKIHRLKTGALIQAAFLLPVLYHGREKLLPVLEKVSARLGLAFQIADDILDVTSTSEVLGKPAGSDRKNEKSTYVSLLGLETARKQAGRNVKQAKQLLLGLKKDTRYLEELADYIVSRIN